MFYTEIPTLTSTSGTFTIPSIEYLSNYIRNHDRKDKFILRRSLSDYDASLAVNWKLDLPSYIPHMYMSTTSGVLSGITSGYAKSHTGIFAYDFDVTDEYSTDYISTLDNRVYYGDLLDKVHLYCKSPSGKGRHMLVKYTIPSNSILNHNEFCSAYASVANQMNLYRGDGLISYDPKMAKKLQKMVISYDVNCMYSSDVVTLVPDLKCNYYTDWNAVNKRKDKARKSESRKIEKINNQECNSIRYILDNIMWYDRSISPYIHSSTEDVIYVNRDIITSTNIHRSTIDSLRFDSDAIRMPDNTRFCLVNVFPITKVNNGSRHTTYSTLINNLLVLNPSVCVDSLCRYVCSIINKSNTSTTKDEWCGENLVSTVTNMIQRKLQEFTTTGLSIIPYSHTRVAYLEYLSNPACKNRRSAVNELKAAHKSERINNLACGYLTDCVSKVTEPTMAGFLAHSSISRAMAYKYLSDDNKAKLPTTRVVNRKDKEKRVSQVIASASSAITYTEVSKLTGISIPVVSRICIMMGLGLATSKGTKQTVNHIIKEQVKKPAVKVKKTQADFDNIFDYFNSIPDPEPV